MRVKILSTLFLLAAFAININAQLNYPDGITAKSTGTNSIKISWSPVSGAGQYYIYRSGSMYGSYSYVGLTTSTEYTNSGLYPDTYYCYKIASAESGSPGELSSPYCAKTDALTPPTPTPPSTGDVQGEVYISTFSDGRLMLQNYENTYEIPKDGSFELTSSSYVYLSVNGTVNLKSINVAGMLYIRANGLAKLNIGTLSKPTTAIQCDALVMGGESLSLNVEASESGIKSNTFIEIREGTYTINSDWDIGNWSMVAGTFITIGPSENSSAEVNISGANGLKASGDIIIDGANKLTISTGDEGIYCKSLLMKNAAITNIISEIRGITTTEDVIVDSRSVITTNGDEGIYADGIVRASGQSTIYCVGKANSDRVGAGAIVATKGIYGIGGSSIQEYFNNSFLQVFENVKNINNYILEGTKDEANRRYVRNHMVPDEYVKIDSQSEHILKLEE